jgi:nitrilase
MVSSNDLERNLDVAAHLLGEAAEKGAKLAVLPETFALFSARQQAEQGQQEAFGEKTIRNFLSQQARELGLWLVGGTLPLATDKNESRVLASCFVIDDHGVERGRYDKIHLFDVDVADRQGSYKESDTFQAGDKVLVLDTPVGRLGVAVCYDLRFPELFSAMREQGAELIAVPAAFTKLTGQAHWMSLLRARAIETQCYVLGANQGGVHSKSRETSGGSAVVDGWGNILQDVEMGEACLVADVDLSELHRQRLAMPVIHHRKAKYQ